jgi:hypothetical protein
MATISVFQKRSQCSDGTLLLDVAFSNLKGDPTQTYPGDFQTVTGATLFYTACSSDGSVPLNATVSSFQLTDAFCGNCNSDMFVGKSTKTDGGVTRSGVELLNVSSWVSYVKSPGTLYKCSMLFNTDSSSSTTSVSNPESTIQSANDFYLMGNTYSVPILNQLNNPASDTTNVYFTLDWGSYLLAQKTLIVKDLSDPNAASKILGTSINFVADSSYTDSDNGVQKIVLCATLPTDGVTASSSNSSVIAYDNTYCYVKCAALKAGHTYSITATSLTRGLVQNTSTPPVFFGYSPGQGASPTINYIYCDANKSQLNVYYSAPADVNNRANYKTADIPAGSSISGYRLTSGSGISFSIDGTQLSSGIISNESLLVNSAVSTSKALSANSILNNSTGVVTQQSSHVTAIPTGYASVAGMYLYTLPVSSFPSTANSLYFGLTAIYDNAIAADGSRPKYQKEWSKTYAYNTAISFVKLPVINTLTYDVASKQLTTPINGVSNLFTGNFNISLTGNAGSSSLVDSAGVPTDRIKLSWALYDDYYALSSFVQTTTTDADLESVTTQQPTITWNTITNATISATGVSTNVPFTGNYTIILPPQTNWVVGRYITVKAEFGTSGSYSVPQYITLFYQKTPVFADSVSVTPSVNATNDGYTLKMSSGGLTTFGLGDLSYSLKKTRDAMLTKKTAVNTAISAIQNLQGFPSSSPSSYSSTGLSWVSAFATNWGTIDSGIPTLASDGTPNDERSDNLYKCLLYAGGLAKLITGNTDVTFENTADINTSMISLSSTLTGVSNFDSTLKATLSAAVAAHVKANSDNASYKVSILRFIYQAIVAFKGINRSYFTEYVESDATNYQTKYTRASNLEKALDANIILNYTVNNGLLKQQVTLRTDDLDALFDGTYPLQASSGMSWSPGAMISIDKVYIADVKINTLDPAVYSDVLNQTGLVSPYATTNSTIAGVTATGSSLKTATLASTNTLSVSTLSAVKTSDASQVKFTFTPNDANVNSFKLRYAINNGAKSALTHSIDNVNFDPWVVTLKTGGGDDTVTASNSHSRTDTTDITHVNYASHYIGNFGTGDLITVYLTSYKNSSTDAATGIVSPAVESTTISTLNLVPSTAATIASITFTTAQASLSEQSDLNSGTYLDDIVTLVVNNNGSPVTTLNMLNIYEDTITNSFPTSPYVHMSLAQSAISDIVSNSFTGGNQNIAGLIDINTVSFIPTDVQLDSNTTLVSVKASGAALRYGAVVPSQTVVVLRYATTSMKLNTSTNTVINANGLIGTYGLVLCSQNTSGQGASFLLQQRQV